MNKAEVKARVLAEMAQRLEKLLSEVEGQAELGLSEIERLALRARSEMGQVVTETLSQTQTSAAVEGAFCPECQSKMEYKGMKSRYVRTGSGEVRLKRPYSYCRQCRGGHFPPG
jgi:hypothetical protein